MKKRIYVETTVVSYFTARPSRDLMVAGYECPEICSPEELLEVGK